MAKLSSLTGLTPDSK